MMVELTEIAAGFLDADLNSGGYAFLCILVLQI